MAFEFATKGGEVGPNKETQTQAKQAGLRPLSLEKMVGIVTPSVSQQWGGPPDLQKKFEVMNACLADANGKGVTEQFSALWQALADDPTVITVLSAEQVRIFFQACKQWRAVDTSREGSGALSAAPLDEKSKDMMNILTGGVPLPGAGSSGNPMKDLF